MTCNVDDADAAKARSLRAKGTAVSDIAKMPRLEEWVMALNTNEGGRG